MPSSDKALTVKISPLLEVVSMTHFLTIKSLDYYKDIGCHPYDDLGAKGFNLRHLKEKSHLLNKISLSKIVLAF